MSNTDLHIQENLTTWLSPFFDDDTKNSIKELQSNNPEDLNDSFYKNLEFGTGGMPTPCGDEVEAWKWMPLEACCSF